MLFFLCVREYFLHGKFYFLCGLLKISVGNNVKYCVSDEVFILLSFGELQLPDDIEWHFIGNLQSNKVKPLLSMFSFLPSLFLLPSFSLWTNKEKCTFL